MKKILFLLLITVNAFGQTTGLGRVVQRPSINNVSVPNGFTTADLLYSISDSTTYQRSSNGTWYKSPVQLSKQVAGYIPVKGDKGDKGDTGAQGVPGKDGMNGTGGGTNYASVRWVGTNNELRLALQDVANGVKIGSIIAYQYFTCTDSFALPKTTMPLDLNGNNMTVTTNGTLFYRDTKDVTEANNIIDFNPHIYNWVFRDINIDNGTTPKGNAIRLSSTYTSTIEHNRFYGYETAIKCDFCLGLTIEHNRFWAQKTTSISVGWNGVPGGNPSTTQSNVTRIQDNVIRVEPTGFAAIAIYGASGTQVLSNVIEGGDAQHNGSQYGVYFDNSSSPNVKSGTVSYNHFEVKFSKARCLARFDDGNFYYERNYFQYTGVDLESVVPSGYPKFHVIQPDYLPSPTTYTNGGGVWIFKDLEWSFDPFAQSTWGTSPIPSSIYLERFGDGSDKLKVIKTKPAMTINGKYY
jgi:hypothetical protein